MEKFVLIILLGTSLATQSLHITDISSNPEASMDFTQYCKYLGYPVESHYVTTTDGYILHMHHIGAKNATDWNTMGPVLFQHGLIDSSDTWVINDEDAAPGLIMVNAGYDVWFGNSRGNRYSTNHTSLNPDKDAVFWDFTWQDMAEYDVPAQVDYVLDQTGQPNLYYIGHSQGTTQMFAHTSRYPDFSEKIRVHIAIAPITAIGNSTSNIARLGADLDLLQLMSDVGINDFLGFGYENTLLYHFCNVLGLVCNSVLYLIADEDVNEDNCDRLPVILGHFPAGTSVKDMKHFAQMITYKAPQRFQMYDYGSASKNKDAYGQDTPPLYDLTKIKTKTALFGGKNDRFADPEDVPWITTQIPSEYIVWYKDDYNDGHGTFIWGKKEYVQPYFSDVMKVIQDN